MRYNSYEVFWKWKYKWIYIRIPLQVDMLTAPFLKMRWQHPAKASNYLVWQTMGPVCRVLPHLYHFGNLAILPEKLYGVHILPGVEANIINYEGELDIPLLYLDRMKLVLVGLHVICYPGGTSEQNTRAYISAMKNPFTDNDGSSGETRL